MVWQSTIKSSSCESSTLLGVEGRALSSSNTPCGLAHFALDFGADAATLRKSFGALDYEELRALKGAMDKRLDVLYPGGVQLPGARAVCATGLDAEYLI